MGEQHGALSRELSDFLIELAIALNKHAIYPEGHPSLVPAAGRVLQRLEPLVAERSSLVLGVARDRLVIDGVATDPGNAVLRELATRLHRHQLAAVTFRRDLGESELHTVLDVLSVDPDRSGTPLGAEESTSLSGWHGIRLYPLDYGSLELADALDADAQDRVPEITQLWIALARAVMERDGTPGAGEPPQPDVLARSISATASDAAYDEVIVDYMLKLAAELRRGGDWEAPDIGRRVSELVTALDPAALSRLLRTVGRGPRAQEFLLNASHGLALDAVIALVRAAAEAREEGISHALLRLFEKLAAHTTSGDTARKQQAEPALREQVATLLAGWSLRDPTPSEYGRALTRMAGSGRMLLGDGDRRGCLDPLHVVQMALEIGAPSESLTAAVRQLEDLNRVAELLATLETARPSRASRAVWDTVLAGTALDGLLLQSPLDVVALDRLLHRAGTRAADALLDALAISESGQTRRILLDRLARMGPAVARVAAQRLDRSPWYVQRNILRLLGDVGGVPDDVDLVPYATAADPRVRIEAIRLMLRDSEYRERAIVLALQDRNEHVRETGLLAAAERCPSAAGPVVASLTAHGNERLAVMAVRALAACDDPSAVRTLLQLVQPRRSWFGTRAPAKTRLYLEALQALRRHHAHPHVAAVLAAACESDDPDVQRAAAPQEAVR